MGTTIIKLAKPVINILVASLLVVLAGCDHSAQTTTEASHSSSSTPAASTTIEVTQQGKNVVAEIFTGEW